MKLGDISVCVVELMGQAVESLGGNPEFEFEQYQLDATKLNSPDARISIPRFMRLGHACIEAYDIPWLGLEMGRLTTPGHQGLAGLVAQTAPDIKTACRSIAEFELLSSFNARGRTRFLIEKGEGVAHFYSISPYNAYNLFVVDSVLGGWVKMLQWISGRTDVIKRLQFEFKAPDYLDYYEQYFDCDIEFGAERNAVVIHDWALGLPSVHRCASTHHGLKQLAERELERVRLGLSFREVIERAIGPLLKGKTPTLEDVSHRLNMAPWTIRRRLNAEKISFQQVMNDTRRDLAVSYVRDTSLTLGEIAYLLGFGSTAAFQRAFKRWTGQAPGRFRDISRNRSQ